MPVSSFPHIAIFGAGAIGVWLAGRLAHGGVPVSLVVRPASAARLAQQGLTVDEEGGVSPLRLPPETPGLWLGPPAALAARVAAGLHPDHLLVITKSQQIVPALDELAPLIGPRTLVSFLQNGIPWWYLHGVAGPLAALNGQHLASIDPAGAIPAALPLSRVLGGVIHKSAELRAPGHAHVRSASGDGLLFGSPLSGAESSAEARLTAALRQCGIEARHSADIRLDIWKKLLGNAVLNPISALADASMGDIVDFPPARRLALAGMAEAAAVARACGVALDIDLDQRLARSRAVASARTSMLQDKALGRALEIDGILGGLLELAHLTHTPAPHLETLYAATALLSRNLQRLDPATDTRNNMAHACTP
jgi:2-dehydropantoate 2-reductase